MQVDIYNLKNSKVGTCELPEDVFGEDVNQALLWQQVNAQRASWRQGTHATRKRGEVSGGGRKPMKQKGTGGARQGSIRAPNHVGGGKVFGPQPRSYAYRLPRSARKAALRSALALRLQSGSLVVLDAMAFEQPKTKEFLAVAQNFAWSSALLVDQPNENLALSTRNVPKFKALPASALNVYDILNHDTLVITKSALDAIIERVRYVRPESDAPAVA